MTAKAHAAMMARKRFGCECGNPATHYVHSEWICERCRELERDIESFHAPNPHGGGDGKHALREKQQRWGWRTMWEAGSTGTWNGMHFHAPA